jgi:hypothetical protein
MNRTATILFASLGFLLAAGAPKPPPAIDISRSAAKVEFPETITFSIKAASDSPIQTLELEFGLTGRGCTPDINLVVPDDFSPATEINLTYTWDVGSVTDIPPGMRLWWDWRLVDEAGNEARSDKEWITWIDSIHEWKTLTSGNILLHWYRGTEAYNQDLMKTAETAREFLQNDIGAWPSEDINLYIYGSNQEMKDALVGEPDWIGGLSYSENQRTILIGIDPGNEKWGKATIAHELTHTAIDGIMGGCFGTVPLWLNEGSAMNAEGPLEADYAAVLDDGIYYDTLFSLRSISYAYQYIDSDPTLTYAEAYSVVRYLIDSYGNKKIQRLLNRLGEGYTYDNALLDSLGVDMDGLEALWRKSIGADPMRQTTPEATADSMLVATLPPASPPLMLSTPTPMLQPTEESSAAGFLGTDVFTYPWDLIVLCGLSLICLAVILAAVLIVVLGRRKSAAKPAGEGS